MIGKRKSLDLISPRQEINGVLEPEYTNLQLTRHGFRIDEGLSGITKMFAVLGLGLALILGVSQLRSNSADDRLKNQITAIKAARVEGRITTCKSAIIDATTHNKLVERDQNFVNTILTDAANRGPAEQKAFTLAYRDARVAEYNEAIVPTRKCTDYAIRLYYKTAGRLGCEKTEMNSKGECVLPTTVVPES